MKPNIFDISAKELSQDAFITWLLQWADSANKTYDVNLNKCGAAFVTELIKKEFPDFKEKIISVRTERQWEKIDVCAEVNDKYLIIIEDKTFTKQHSKQLARYRASAQRWCRKQNPKYKLVCIYLKTGNESQQDLRRVTEEAFKIYNRHEFIDLLQKHNLENDIYTDFKSRLLKIESTNSEWENKIIKEWNGNDWQGFFQYLEGKKVIINWCYVNNPGHAFWCAVLNWDYWDIYPIYLQIEEYKLCFKISTDPEEVEIPDNVSRGEIRNKISELILNAASEKGLSTIRRPDKFGSGKSMTVAVVDGENWLGDKEEKINKVKVAERLLNYKNFLLDVIG